MRRMALKRKLERFANPPANGDPKRGIPMILHLSDG